MNCKKILIITHSSLNGLNERQATECANVIGFEHFDITRTSNPLDFGKHHLDCDKIIMIVPEWNTSFPWTFKKMIDDSGYPSYFKGKEILLMGTSNTTFGNIVGINHLHNILEWIGAKVCGKVCVPNIDKKFANNDIQVDERLNERILKFVNC